MIREREYGAVSGLAALVVLLAQPRVLPVAADPRDPGSPRPAHHCLRHRLRLLAAFLLTGLFVVNPNEAKVLQLFGPCRHGTGPALRQPAVSQAHDLTARAQFRRRQAEGQRPRRKSDRSCGRRRLEGRRQPRYSKWTTTTTTCTSERVGAQERWRQATRTSRATIGQ